MPAGCNDVPLIAVIMRAFLGPGGVAACPDPGLGCVLIQLGMCASSGWFQVSMRSILMGVSQGVKDDN